jgi:hypothetical protein
LVQESDATSHLLVAFLRLAVAFLVVVLLRRCLLKYPLHLSIALFGWVNGSLGFDLVIVLVVSLDSFLDLLISCLHFFLVLLVVVVSSLAVDFLSQRRPMRWGSFFMIKLSLLLTFFAFIVVLMSLSFKISVLLVIID